MLCKYALVDTHKVPAPTGHVGTIRAFAGYWSVDAKEETAMNGQWREGPGLELFQSLQKQLGDVPILAEDLGVITKDVVQLRCVHPAA